MKSDNVREWLVERVALNEAPPGTTLNDAESRRLAGLEADDQAILAHYPPAGVVEEVRRRTHREARARRGRRGRAGFAIASVAVGAAAALLFTPAPPPSDRAPLEVTRLKGRALVVHEKTPDGARMMRSGDRVERGDRLQLSYRLDGAAYATLFSVDGRGTVSLHLPERPGQPAPRLEAGEASLPHSYELDDAPAFERFFLVTSDRAFEVREVLAAAERLAEGPASARAALELPDRFSWIDLLLVKEPAR